MKPTRLLCANGGHPMDLQAHTEGFDTCTSCRTHPRIRRRTYWPGHCQDCDRDRDVTRIVFPDSPTERHVCRRCVRTYRGIILAP